MGWAGLFALSRSITRVGAMAADHDPPGPLIGHGRAADVYDIGGGRVLRRNRGGESTAREAAVMQHVAAHGYPVPAVYDAEGGDLVMDRIDGPTMLDAFPRRPWKLRSWAAVLAQLHDQLAEIPVPDIELPHRFGDPEVLVHADLHPDNVMLSATGPIVIDWPNTAVGPRGADVASTWLILAVSELDAGPVARKIQAAGRSLFVRMFLDRSDRQTARSLLPALAEHRLNDRNLRPSEATNIGQLLADEGLA